MERRGILYDIPYGDRDILYDILYGAGDAVTGGGDVATKARGPRLASRDLGLEMSKNPNA